MTQAMLSPREAIYCFRHEQIEGHALAEALARYPKWQVAIVKPNTHYEPLIQFDEKDRPFINLFSNPKYIQPFLDKWGLKYQAQHYAETVGHFIFKHLPKQIAYLNIDPETAHGVHYRQAQIKLLQAMGKMVEIDGFIEKLGQITQKNVDAYKGLLKSIQDCIFHILIFNDNRIASAPDNYGKRLATAFTSKQAALEYVGWLRFNYPNRNLPTVTKTSGAALFSQLADSNKLGVVFNCQGPIRPVLLAKQFCDWVAKA